MLAHDGIPEDGPELSLSPSSGLEGLSYLPAEPGKSRNILPAAEISVFMFLSNTFKQLLSVLMFLG